MLFNKISEDIIIYKNESVKTALKKLDRSAQKVLIVMDTERVLLGTISDGDIRRYILKGESLDKSVDNVYNTKCTSFKENCVFEAEVKRIFVEKKIGLIPVVDEKNKVISYLTWSELLNSQDRCNSFHTNKNINIPVVIMAGGKGSRLEPFTNIFPKALIPVGERTIMEMIIDGFKIFGIDQFYITLNHKGAMIESYFSSIDKNYNLDYVREDNFFGTAGSLKLLQNRIKENFIISNCDIIVKADYDDVLNFHNKNSAYLTILSSIQHHKVPYGVVSFKNGGEVTNITEKPEYTFTVNTGVYVLNSDALEYIPSNTQFDMTDLIKVLLEKNKRVVTYPVNENDYIDIGQWAEYKKAIEKFSII